MKRKSKVFFAASVLLFVGAFMLMGLTRNNYFDFPVVTNAEKNSETVSNITGEDFTAVNQLAKNYKAAPSYATARELANKALETVSILELSESQKSPILDQVAAAHFNGSSNIQESNIVTTINDLAARANAPNFAYTDADQVAVTRKYLNRVMPDLVSANNGMTDAEAFVVFASLLSQKIDNEDFMVAPGQFTANMNNVTGSEIPGRPENSGQVEITQESAQTYQMLDAINNYIGSKQSLAANEVITMLGIQ